MDISKTRIETILKHVISVVREWPRYAEYVGLSETNTKYIQSHHTYSEHYKNYIPCTPYLDKVKEILPEAYYDIEKYSLVESITLNKNE